MHYVILTKNVFGYILGYFFASSSGHPVLFLLPAQQLTSSVCPDLTPFEQFLSQKYARKLHAWKKGFCPFMKKRIYGRFLILIRDPICFSSV
jgi:hypothetical protein